MKRRERVLRGFLAGLAAAAILGCGSDDTTAPRITAFERTSLSATTHSNVTFRLEAGDGSASGDALDYFISTSADTPAADAAGWAGAVPTSFDLSGDRGLRTLYAWAKDGAGNVSDPATISLLWASPGMEDTLNWDKMLESGTDFYDLPGGLATDSANRLYATGSSADLTIPAGGYVLRVFDAEGEEDTAAWNKRQLVGLKALTADAIALDANGNVYLGGFGTNLVDGSSDEDGWIKKFSSAGVEDTVNWDKELDREGNKDRIRDLGTDGDGNVIAVGYATGAGTQEDWWIQKFNSAGALAWPAKYQNGGSSQNDRPRAVAVDGDNNIIAVGYTSNGTPRKNWWLKKYNAAGAEDIGWNKTVTSSGDWDDEALDVAVDSGNNVYVIGYGYQLASGTSDNDIWIKKFQSDGTEVVSGWDKKIDVGTANDLGLKIAIDGQNNIYTLSLALVNGLSPVYVVKKFSADGSEDIAWNLRLHADSVYLYPDLYSLYAMVRMALDPAGNLYLSLPVLNQVGATSGVDWNIRKLIND
jgi:uncharacterized delta-60 repeat protein